MRIDFFDLLEDKDWAPAVFDQSNPSYSWGGGGPLAHAPVDMAATFDGAMWRSLRVDPDFNMGGVKCRPNFTIPWHHHSLRELIIVMGGEFTVESEDGGGPRTVRAGDFWVELKTTWHEGGWAKP